MKQPDFKKMIPTKWNFDSDMQTLTTKNNHGRFRIALTYLDGNFRPDIVFPDGESMEGQTRRTFDNMYDEFETMLRCKSDNDKRAIRKQRLKQPISK